LATVAVAEEGATAADTNLVLVPDTLRQPQLMHLSVRFFFCFLLLITWSSFCSTTYIIPFWPIFILSILNPQAQGSLDVQYSFFLFSHLIDGIPCSM
jgi:hypothetical protein